jgi:mannan endo-1,4-beta-mannosidase
MAPAKIGVDEFIERSVNAARIIRRIDPDAWIFGPSLWGVTGYLDFSGQTFWWGRARHGNFVASYLDAFAQASEQDGARLLDCLDVHWYPAHRNGDLYRNEDPSRAPELLNAPRTLTEPGYIEDSWVGDISRKLARAGLPLPILPSLQAQIDRWFPGTRLTVSEFNFGGPGGGASGLAVADALGRLGRAGVFMANHWGALDGTIGEAYRLYRGDDDAQAFGSASIEVDNDHPELLSAFAAHDEAGAGLKVVAINKSTSEISLRVDFDRSDALTLLAASGFEETRPQMQPMPEPQSGSDGAHVFRLPPRSATRFDFG